MNLLSLLLAPLRWYIKTLRAQLTNVHNAFAPSNNQHHFFEQSFFDVSSFGVMLFWMLLAPMYLYLGYKLYAVFQDETPQLRGRARARA